jgi:hypothetical protein
MFGSSHAKGKDIEWSSIPRRSLPKIQTVADSFISSNQSSACERTEIRRKSVASWSCCLSSEEPLDLPPRTSSKPVSHLQQSQLLPYGPFWPPSLEQVLRQRKRVPRFSNPSAGSLSQSIGQSLPFTTVISPKHDLLVLDEARKQKRKDIWLRAQASKLRHEKEQRWRRGQDIGSY